MNKFLMGAAATALILSSCAKNDLLNGPDASTPNDGRIRFAASTGLNTKAATDNPFNSTGDLQKLGEFSVQGHVEGVGTDLIGDNMKWSGSSWEYKTKAGSEPYWPSTWMDFYAYANWGLAPTITPHATTGSITATGVTIGDDNITNNSGQKDLLVAITPNATKEVRTLLTFKHALTQIVFKAGNINSTKLEVKVAGVELLNVMSAGNMSFAKNDMKISWSNTNTLKSYTVQGIKEEAVKEIPAGSENNYSLFPRIQTDAPDPANNALMLIPQEFEAWEPTSGLAPNATTAGASIKIMASLYDKTNVTNTALSNAKTVDGQKALQVSVYCGKVEFVDINDQSKGSKVTPEALYIPVDSKSTGAGYWEPGKRINYIISFGDGQSGSGGGGYDEDGTPILIPIKFRAVVEEWTEVNVPLLSANIDANSSAITHQFINGFTNQLLSDIKAAPAPKNYTAKLTFSGASSTNIATTITHANLPANVTFTSLIGGPNTFENAKFLPGSTFTYDFTGVDFTNGAAIIVIPKDWFGQSLKDANVINSNINEDTVVPINGTNINKLILTKKARSGYSFVTNIGFIQDNLNALEANENGATQACGNTIFVNGAINNHFVFSSEPLAKLTAAPVNSTVTIDMSAVTGWANGTIDVKTWCPIGWKATASGNTYAGGETIILTAGGNIVFTKVSSTFSATYQNHAGLAAWLATNPTTGTYYYNNVDYDVEINDATFASGTPQPNVEIHLKYPISTEKNKVTNSEWGYAAGVYTKK